MKYFPRRSWIALFLMLIATLSYAEEFKVAIKQLATSEQYKKLLQAVAETTGNTLTIEVYPPARSAALIEAGQVDIEVPALMPKDKTALAALKYEGSSAPVFDLAFVLYSAKGAEIDIMSLKNGNPKGYKIETDGSVAAQLGFKALVSTNIEGSMRKVDQGIIDGYIFSQLTADPVLKKTGLTNIKRELYDSYSLAFALPKGKKGGSADKMLIDGIKKLNANGTFTAIFGDMVRDGKYNSWQP